MAGVAYAAVDLWRRSPRDVQVHFRWGESRQGLRAAEIHYLRDGAEVRRVTFRYPHGAPHQQLHATRLARGGHIVHLRLDTTGGPRELRRPLRVAGEDVITLRGPW